mgnify:CR=1 FL=1
MRTEWVKSWKSSKQPRKQRKYAYNAPAHVSQRKMRAPLSKTLRQTHKKRALGVRVGDEVRILRGDFKGRKGKVERVVKRLESVVVAGVSRQKSDGSKSSALIHASKVMITKLNLDDSKRLRKK